MDKARYLKALQVSFDFSQVVTMFDWAGNAIDTWFMALALHAIIVRLEHDTRQRQSALTRACSVTFHQNRHEKSCDHVPLRCETWDTDGLAASSILRSGSKVLQALTGNGSMSSGSGASL